MLVGFYFLFFLHTHFNRALSSTSLFSNDDSIMPDDEKCGIDDHWPAPTADQLRGMFLKGTDQKEAFLADMGSFARDSKYFMFSVFSSLGHR